MKYLAVVILLSSCAFNESEIQDLLEAQTLLQMKYSVLDQRLDECIGKADEAYDQSVLNREEIRELLRGIGK